MKAITGFLEDFDFMRLLPELGRFISDLRFWIGVVLMIGPLVMLILGIWYYFFPTKQANHSIGFRIYFGMGSTEAWRFTQRFAGMLFMILGGGLSIAMLIVCLVGLALDPLKMATTAVVCMCVEALLVLIGYILIQVKVSSRFDKEGNPRKKA